jgi:hypothetical protein
VTKRTQIIEATPETDADRLWAAMLHIYPHIINKAGPREQPQGCAHLCREFAEALLTEWKGTSVPYDSAGRPVGQETPPTNQAG